MTITLVTQNFQHNSGKDRTDRVCPHIKSTTTVSDGLWVKPDESDNVPHTVSPV